MLVLKDVQIGKKHNFLTLHPPGADMGEWILFFYLSLIKK